MHAFLTVCVAVLAVYVGFLSRKVRTLERSDATADIEGLTELCDAVAARQAECDAAVKELSETQSEHAKEVSEAITGLVESIEKMRRSRSGSGGSAAFEITRARAEKATYHGSAKTHDELVALAEG